MKCYLNMECYSKPCFVKTLTRCVNFWFRFLSQIIAQHNSIEPTARNKIKEPLVPSTTALLIKKNYFKWFLGSKRALEALLCLQLLDSYGDAIKEGAY